jgi:hypothetical protein
VPRDVKGVFFPTVSWYTHKSNFIYDHAKTTPFPTPTVKEPLVNTLRADI